MIYIRNLLKKIRQVNARLNEKQRIAIVMGVILMAVVGFVADNFLPFGFVLNTLRAAFAIVEGALIFSILYLLSIKRNNPSSNEETEKLTMRERFSYKERVNISVILWAIWFLVLLFTSKENTFFTNLSSVLIAAAIAILAFVRSTRDEDAKARMGLEDARDLMFEKRRKEEELRREEEEKSNKQKDD